jgi:hypothetical protein
MREIYICHRNSKKCSNGILRRKGLALILRTLKSATSKYYVSRKSRVVEV